MFKEIIINLLQGYMWMSQQFYKQNKDLLLLIIRALYIQNGIQELSLINGINTDTKKIYNIISQFLITNHLIDIDNQNMLIYLFIFHFLINFLCFTFICNIKGNKSIQFALFLLIKIQHNLFILPTWKVIFSQTRDNQTPQIYITSILNIIMYIQPLLWFSTFKQTQLIDITGVFSDSNLFIEVIHELLIIAAIFLSELFTDACAIVLIIRQLFKIIFIQSIFNQNSQFVIVFHVIMIILIFAFNFNIQFIYLVQILTYSISLALIIYKRYYNHYISTQQLSLQKCQLLEIFENSKIQTQLILIQKTLMKLSLNSQNKILMIDDFFQQLLQEKSSNRSLIVKLQLNYTSGKYPLKSLIQFHSQYKCSNLFNEAYINVVTQQINEKIKFLTEKQKLKLNTQKLNIEGFLKSFLKSQQSLLILEQTLKQKLSLLEYLRLGLSGQSKEQNKIQPYIQQIYKCKQQLESIYDIKNYCINGQKNSDILTLRILQMYFGIIMANQKKAYEIQKEIDDLLRFDKQFIENTLNNQILLTNRTMMIQTSLIHDKGQLINYNKEQIASFYQCSREQISNYKYIYDFMPDYIAPLHDDFISNFQIKGYSNLMETGSLIFLKTPSNFLLPGYIHLYNPLKMDDVTLYAIITQPQQYFDYILFDSFGMIVGATQKIFNFITDLISEQKSKYFRINDILDKGGHILHYIPLISTHLEILAKNIRNSQNYQLSNIRSFWELPQNNSECIIQTQIIINQNKQQTYNNSNSQQNDNYKIDNNYIPILDPNFQFLFLNILNNKTTYKISEVKQKIELIYNLQIQKISNRNYFILQIQDYRISDAATTIMSTSQNKSNNATLSLMSECGLMQDSERISSEGHQIKEIQVFNNLHQQLLVEKLLFDDPEIDFDNVQDKNSSKQINFSHNQSKTPFILTQRQTHRQLLSGQQSYRGSMQRTEFVLPQVSVQEQINKDYDILNQLERDMVEISKQKQQSDRIIDEVKDEIDADFMSKSIKTLKEFEQQATVSYIKQNTLQIELIREIVDTHNNIRLLRNAKTLNWLLELLIAGYIILVTILVKYQFQICTQQLEDLSKLQNLNNIIVSNYQLIQSKYMNAFDIYPLSPFLSYQLNTTLYDYFQKSINDQLELEIFGCFILDTFATDSNFEKCFIFYNQLQEDQLSYYRDGILSDSTYKYKTNPTHFQQSIVYLIYKFLGYSTDLIENNSNLQLSDAFLVILMMCLIMTVTIFIFLFKVIQAKQNLKSKLLALLSRLTPEELVEQIATLTIILESWKTQQWKLFNFYDLWEQKKKVTNQEQQSPKKNKRKGKTTNYIKVIRDNSFIFVETVILVLLLSFFICGDILLLNLFQSYIPSIKVNQQFLLFQQKIDSGITLGKIIKTEPLINNFRNISEQGQVISLYLNITQILPTQLLEIINQIVNYDFIDSQSIQNILDLMNGDYCLLYNLNFCSSNSTSLEKYQNETYQQFLKQGLNSFISNLQAFTISEFQYESTTYQFQKNELLLLQTINQRLYTNIFIEFTIEIQRVVDEIQTMLIQGSTEAKDLIIQKLVIYYFILGPILMLLIFIITFILIKIANIEILQHKYLILLLSDDKLENSVIKQKIINIRTYFY